MKLWKDNRIDQEWELVEEEIADRFLASKWADAEAWPWPLDRRLRAFMTEKDDGLSSVWTDEAAYERVVGIILDTADRRSPS